MTTHRSSRTASTGPTTVVVDLTGPRGDALLVLDVHGPHDAGRLSAALDRVAARCGAPVPPRPRRLMRRGPGHHTLYFLSGAFDGCSAGLLADLLTQGPPAAGTGRRIRPSPLQRELLADADAHPGTPRHCEQLTAVWHGPLDHARFTAAWESVFARESVLRAAFEDGPEPSVVLHERVVPEIVRHAHGSIDWYALAEEDRRRGLDPRTPGPLRITVLGGDPHPSARILLTFHHALLDAWSVRLLLRQFRRAYLAGGSLPGGERRPDVGDHADWLAARDTAPARAFWSRADTGPGTDLPGPGDGTGTGHLRTRLTVRQTARLRAWAARWGSPESSALHAAWALLLYRVSGAVGRATVRFGIAVPGRGVLLDGVERMPGALRTPLPAAVVVDPRDTVPALLTRLRDHALDLSAHEWVSPGQARSWSGRSGKGWSPGEGTGTLLVFDGGPPEPHERCGAHELHEPYDLYDPHDPRLPASRPDAHAVRMTSAETMGARTLYPVTLVAHHDDEERLVLTFSYDRERLAEADADAVLAHTAGLLCTLPATTGGGTPVGEALELLAGLPRTDGTTAPTDPDPDPTPDPAAVVTSVPVPAPAAAPPGDPPLVLLRAAAHPGAGAVCLVQSPGTPRHAHTRLAAVYQGPQALVLLPAPSGDRTGPALRAALRDIAADGPLVLGAFSGGGVAACEIAQSLTTGDGPPPPVVLTATTAPATDFARILAAAARRTR